MRVWLAWASRPRCTGLFTRLLLTGNLPILTMCKNKHGSYLNSGAILTRVLDQMGEKEADKDVDNDVHKDGETFNFSYDEKREVIKPPNTNTQWTAVRSYNSILK